MRIIIADDDDDVRAPVQMMLSSAGHRVSAHPDGRLAWEALQKEGADLAVLDINMPGMDGLELLDLIRGDTRYKDMPIILLTGAKNTGLRTSALQRGADDYIIKPFDKDDFLRRVALLGKAFSADHV